MESLKQFAKADLPEIQKEFINQFDGTIENIVNFSQLHIILNPTFSYHYFLVDPGHFSFEKGETVGTVTTKSTTGETAPWGNQSKEAENNAYLLKEAIKDIFKKEELFVQSGGNFNPYDSKIMSKSKLFVRINGQMRRISGLTALNLR